MFDRSMRHVAEAGLGSLCAWLGEAVSERLDHPVEKLPATFTSETREVDLLVRVGAGRLLHVEYVRTPSSDLYVRMLGYLAQIMTRHRGMDVTQVVVVLGDGRVQVHDGPRRRLGLHVVYLRECDPAPFLAAPGLEPLAVLAAGDRAASMATAWQAIRARGGPHQGALLEATAVLATIRLDGPTIELIRKESNMTVESIADFYSTVDFGRELIHRGQESGERRGQELGERRGQELGERRGQELGERRLAQALAAQLRLRLGEHPDLDGLARRLARHSDPQVVIEAIASATSPSDLDYLT